MYELNKINKFALEYALHSIPRMKEISEPLRKCLGISSFGYMRTYNNCSYLSLLDGHEEYNKKFFETIPKSDPHFIEALHNAPYGEYSFTLWPISPKTLTPILSLLDAYNLWHGFQITYRRKEYCEMFSFTFDKQSNDKSAFYMQNIPILLKFTTYFKTQAADLIECGKDSLALFPERFNTDFVDNYNFQRLLLDMDKSLVLKDLNDNVTNLTQRESECLKVYLKNKTCKEVAQVFGISPRTVELHIHNIKQKLGVNYKSQLINIYENNFC